jgi:putative membrane protein
MARPFLTNDAKKALSEAVHAVESACGAELVIAVRRRSGSYLDIALAAAIAGAFVTLAFLLFAPWSFALEYFLIDPVVVGILCGVATAHVPALLRLATRRAARRRRVGTAARVTFLDKGVHRTSRRSGILLYISVLEREAEVVADAGVEAVVDRAAWQAVVGAIQEAVRRGKDGVSVAAKVRGLAAVLTTCLPHAAGQVNELADEVSE